MGKRDLEKGKASSKHKKKKKRSSSSSSSSSLSSLSSIDEQTKRKLKKKIKKLKKKEKLKKKKEKKALKKLVAKKAKEEILSKAKPGIPSTASYDIDISLMEKSKSLAPMTKEEWEKQQNTLKRVYDEETGRMRLVRGTGEIVEECVSRDRHLAINKQSTKEGMEKSDVVEEFFGVYLLKCLNPKYKGRTYIGYTVDPNRRIKQHNKGKLYGGAWRTSQKGPWEMTLTVHGFPSDVAALRFEWAWQHPTKSRRLKSIINKKKSSESSFDYYLKVMFTMLRVSPWCRLPLTVRWLSADVMVDPPPNLTPPMHMPILYGPVVSKKLKSPKKKPNSSTDAVAEEEELHICRLCHDIINKKDSVTCLSSECEAQWHVTCLARNFLEKESSFIGTQGASQSRKETRHILPVEGCCSECGSAMLWGDLIRKKKGCYSNMTKTEHNSTDNAFLNSLL